MIADKEDAARLEGGNAYRAGKGVIDNPYSELDQEDQHYAWLSGWTSAGERDSWKPRKRGDKCS